MAIMAIWDDITFQVTPDTALLFENLKLKASCETDDKELNKRKYTNIKIGKGAEITFTVILESSFGINVRNTVMQLLDRAQKGQSGHLIVGGKKLFPFMIRLVSAETEDLSISPKGRWVKAKMNLQFKQASKEWIFGGGEDEGGSGSGDDDGGSGSGGGGGTQKNNTDPQTLTEQAKTETSPFANKDHKSRAELMDNRQI